MVGGATRVGFLLKDSAFGLESLTNSLRVGAVLESTFLLAVLFLSLRASAVAVAWQSIHSVLAE